MRSSPRVPPRLPAAWRDLRFGFWKPSVVDEVEDEIRTHIELRTRANVRRGMDPEAARAEALRRFGDVAKVRGECVRLGELRDKEMRHVEWMDDLRQDVVYALRQFRRAPGFTLVALLTIALGIGATTAIFGVVNGVLLEPLPFEEPDRVVKIWPEGQSGTQPASSLDFLDWRAQARSFEGMAIHGQSAYTLTGSGEPQRMGGAPVSANFFRVMGVRAALGRTFAPDEDRPQAAKVAVLGHAAWLERFGGDASVLGRQLTLNGEVHTIVGVAAPGFDYPNAAEVWTPLVLTPSLMEPRARGRRMFIVVARLKDGETVARGEAEMDRINAGLATLHPDFNGDIPGAKLVTMEDDLVGDVRDALWMLLGAVGLVLLIACANIANLLLVRAVGREGEMAVRAALGAGRGRVVRQLVTESVLLAAVGGALGVAVAAWATTMLVRLAPPDLPRIHEVAVDGRVLLFALLIAVATGLLFGLAPALHAASPDLTRALKETARGSRAGSRSGRVRSALVVAELALSVMLLVGAGLLLRSLHTLRNVDPGFRPDNLLTLSLGLPRPKYADTTAQRAFVEALDERIRAIPGASAVGIGTSMPFSGGGQFTGVEVAGRPIPPERVPTIEMRTAGVGYLEALGIPLVRGRTFTAQDRAGAPWVVLIDQALAKKLFPGEDPVGKHLVFSWLGDRAPGGPEIVGVVGNVKHWSLSEEPQPHVYFSLAQAPGGYLNVVMRAAGDPATLAPALREAIWSLDRNLAIVGLRTMEERLAQSVARPKLYAVLLAVFAGLALLLATVGIYGVMSYAVTQRTREIGIRIALGARRSHVLGLVVGQGMLLALAGVALGVAGAAAGGRLLESLLYGVSASDPATLAVVPLVLTAVALAACGVPALRATRVDPIAALRGE